MKILVTGAAGFIGSYLSRALIWRGDDVVGLDNFNDYYPRKCKEINLDLINMSSNQPPCNFEQDVLGPVYDKIKSYAATEGFVKGGNTGNFTFYEGDIVDYEFLKKVFASHKFDVIVHLAAMAGVPLSVELPRLYTHVNVDGTVNLLQLAKESGTDRFVFASSSSVYGNREDRRVKEEDDVTKTMSIYGASKVAGEVQCHAYHQSFGLKVIVDRIFGPIYGPLQRPYGMFHQRAINYLYNGKTVEIYGKKGLETAKDATYIDDQICGILECVNCRFEFEIFNIGTSDPKAIKTWIDYIEKAFGSKLGVKIVNVDKADVASSADISKAKRMLNYSPKVDMDEGVRRQVEVFKLMPEWYKGMNKV